MRVSYSISVIFWANVCRSYVLLLSLTAKTSLWFVFSARETLYECTKQINSWSAKAKLKKKKKKSFQINLLYYSYSLSFIVVVDPDWNPLRGCFVLTAPGSSEQLTCMSKTVSQYEPCLIKIYPRTSSKCQKGLLDFPTSVPLTVLVSYMCVTEL